MSAARRDGQRPARWIAASAALLAAEATIGADPPPGSAGLMVGQGPGVSAERVLLRG